jgi:hypothetical protein
MALTRRNFMLDSARLAGGLTTAGLVRGVPAAIAADPPRANQLSATSPTLPSPPFRDRDYWSFADWLATYFDSLWDPDRSYYRSGGGTVGRIYHNSALLTTHAIAALTRHNGASRHDARAARLARRLCDSPPWSERTSPSIPDPQFHVPGWTESLGTTDANMDKSIDPKAAEALMYAWRARDVLRLPAETVSLIEDRIARCARGDFFRFPNIRLNQINWHSEMYAHLATVTGDTELLRNDYRAQMERFSNGITQASVQGGSPNLGPGYRFHYLPHKPPDHGLNLDSAEYANMTCHFLIWYEQALRAGMAPLAEEHVRLLRAWVEHIVCGYWTHAGYLNWDTGFSFKRWHVGRTFALARQGLFAIALAPRFHVRPEIGPWAKYMLDAGFDLYKRLSRDAPDGGGIAPAVLFDIKENPLGPSVRELFAARMLADAARAVVLGLGGLEAAEPPPLYSFDPDIGRLAITTPGYSTAILPVNLHAVPYGGIELARLFDRNQKVVSNIAGRPWASFGVVVRDQSARSVLSTQRPRGAPDPFRPALELMQSPRGSVRSRKGSVKRAQEYPSRPYAGSFETLIARGRHESLEVVVETTHRFKRDWIETRWKIARRKRQRYTADVLFPSWGKTATIEAVLFDGTRKALAAPGLPRRRVQLKNVRYFYLAGKETGYVVVPFGRRGAARILKPKRQGGAPDPGPTLAVELAHRAKFKRLDFAVRMAPSGSPEAAEQIALQLSAAPNKPKFPKRPRRRKRRRRSRARRRR